MAADLRRILLVYVALAAFPLAGAAVAQGVFIPTPGSAPAATGPTSVNPSAAPSSMNPNAYNPSAAPSAISTPNALNPSGTPSTFAPQITGPSPPRVVPRPVTIPRRTARPRRPARARTVRGRERPSLERKDASQPSQTRQAASQPSPPGPEVARKSERRARDIMGSVCRGC